MTLRRVNPKRDTSEPLVVDYLRARGALVIRLSARALPDLLVGWCGRWLLLECKTGKAALNKGQAGFFEQARLRGLPCYQVKDWEEAKEILNRTLRLAK
jgi:hypothetical protein